MSRIARLKLAFAAGILVMLANAVIPYQTIAWTSNAAQSIDHSETIIDVANQALSTLKDAETGHRGFIITGKDEFLQPYEEGVQEIRPQFARLENLLADQPAARRRLDFLQQQVEGLIREMDRSLGVRRAKGLEPAAAIVAEGKGKALMDGIRVTLREITLAESNRLADLNLEQKRRNAVATYALALVTLLDLLVLGIVYYLVFRTISEHAATERALHETGERLKSGMAALEVRNREMEILHGMTDALQSATTTSSALSSFPTTRARYTCSTLRATSSKRSATGARRMSAAISSSRTTAGHCAAASRTS
jgi:CHASE3 domain sensor protein